MKKLKTAPSENNRIFIFNKLTLFLGLTPDIVWSVYNKIWGLIKGPIFLMFQILYLNSVEQGIWYTFTSLSALSVFAELGFNNIITQFVSHEYSTLNERNGVLVGTNRDRLISLVKHSFKFYFKVVPALVIFMGVVGWYYFNSVEIEVISAWFVFSVMSGLALLVSLAQAIYMGLDKVKAIQKNLLFGSVIVTFSSVILLYFRFGIWALVISSFIGNCVMVLMLCRSAKLFWFQMWKNRRKSTDQINWFSETGKLQLHYAVSWISGFFIFSMYVPTISKFKGVIVAGQFGLTFVLVQSLTGLANSWIQTKIPKLNMLIAQNQKEEHERLFKSSFKQGVLIYIILSVVFYIVLKIIIQYSNFGSRILPLYGVLIIIIIQGIQLVIGFWAAYLRAHKVEPFYRLSIVNAVSVAIILAFFLPNFFLLTTLFVIMSCYAVIFLPWAYYIFKMRAQ